MSPYEVPPPSAAGTRQAALQALLPRFDVTSNGFLPAELPLERLTDPYYAPWETLMHSLASHIQDNTFRSHIDNLPTLSLDHLSNEQEQRRAYLILTFFVHAYVWGGAEPAEILPHSVTVPLLQLSDILGLPPIATFASFNLWNFTSSNPNQDLTDVDSLKALHTFTGTEDESWFYMVSVAIEAQGAYIIPILLHGLDALQSLLLLPPSNAVPGSTHCEDESAFDSEYEFTPEPHPSKPINLKTHQPALSIKTATNSLKELTTCIAKMGTILEKMHSKCDPTIFYHRIRPFLAGSKNMAAAGLPRGVFYDEGPCPDHEHDQGKGGRRRGEYRQLRGGSNGQSSLIQFLDIILGVEHSSSGNSSPEITGPGKPTESGRTEEGVPGDGTRIDTGVVAQGLTEKTMSFHQEVRSYMPRRHREFLEYVVEHGGGGFKGVLSRLLSLRGDGMGMGMGMGIGVGEDGEFEELIMAFKTATKALAEFRNKHLQLVTRYIVIPSRQQGHAVAVAQNQVGGEKDEMEISPSPVVVNLATASTTVMASSSKNHGEEEVGEVTMGTTSTGEGRTRKESLHHGSELTGTGGTALLPFLKQSRDETLQAGDLRVQQMLAN